MSGEIKREKRQSEGGPSQAGIRVLIVSLFIILLAFFIVLNSIAVVDERKTLAALGSLIGSFGILPGGLSASKEGEVRLISATQVPMASRRAESMEIPDLDKPDTRSVATRTMPKGEVISIQDRVLFDEASYKIKPAGYDFLKRLCKIINEEGYPVEITGHTDSRPPDEKSVRSNWQLSSLRAFEVLKFFVVVGKVLPSRLTAYGCGEHRPVASNETRQTRAQNSRVDIILAHSSTGKLKEIIQKGQSGFVVFKRFVFSIFD
ncbi:MAG: flagellar motor protein MotB [Deltaproteobacteria bacterium]|nr:flagellar motor protein MotB [Deltaproteobacteria bacterium]